MNTAALRRDLAAIAATLGPDELAVLVTLATRAWVGQSRYGCLRLARDRRDFAREASEELVDACCSLAAHVLRAPAARVPARGRSTRDTDHGRAPQSTAEHQTPADDTPAQPRPNVGLARRSGAHRTRRATPAKGTDRAK